MALFEDFPDEIKELEFDTEKKNRQTGIVAKFKLRFRLRCINGIIELEMNKNGGDFKAVKKTDIHQIKRAGIEKLLKLCGYCNLKQNVDKLKMILYALCGICEDMRTVFDKLFDTTTKDMIIKELKNEKFMLLFVVFNNIKQDDLLSVTPFLEKSYSKLFKYFMDDLHNFVCWIWNELLQIWIKHPTDEEFVSAGFAFISSYDEKEKYVTLQNKFNSLKQMDSFDWLDQDFCSLAFGIYQAVNNVFITKVQNSVMNVIVKLKPKYKKGKQLDEEEKYYLHQSIGGATWNSKIRTYYGGNFKENKKAMLIAVVKSVLLNSNTISHARIAYRISIENRGNGYDTGYRIINEPTTKWVAKVMNMIEPDLYNLVLKHKGDFRAMLQPLLNDKELKSEFDKLFDFDEVLMIYDSLIKKQQQDDVKQQNEDIDIDSESDENDKSTLLLLYQQCKERARGDCIKGIFNRSVWGYLKQLREEKDKLTLRNKLRLTLNSLDKKFSSLQVQED